MKKLPFSYIFTLLFSIYFSSLQAQITSEQAEKIDQLFAQFDHPNSPGCAVGVIENGRFNYAKGFGMANIEKEIPFTPDTEFCIGSMTKQFTATCIGLLVQAGKIDIDEDIRTYLPELSNYDQGITIRHLLHHTSGIRDYSGLMGIKGETYKRFTTYQEAADLLQKQKALNFPPNTQHLYSNSGYAMAQEIIRRVSGQSLQEFAAEQIFEPLKMNHTFYNADFERITMDKTVSYVKNREGNIVPCIEQPVGVSNELIQTSLNELLLWDQNFYHHKVGGETLNKILQMPAILENGDTVNYGLGLQLGEYSGLEYVTHGGGNLGYVCEFVRFPEQKKSIIVLLNAPVLNAYSTVFKIADIVLEKEIKAAPKSKIELVPTVQLSKAELKQYCGPYWHTGIDQARYIYLREDTIRYNRPDWYESPLVPIGNHTFKMLNSKKEQTATTVRFVLKEDRKNEMYIRVGDRSESFSYAFEEANANKKYLKPFEGKYFNGEIDFSFEVAFMNRTLYLITDKKMRYKLNLSKADHFIDRAGRKIAFIRDEQQNIKGFMMNLSRVKGLFFQKI